MWTVAMHRKLLSGGLLIRAKQERCPDDKLDYLHTITWRAGASVIFVWLQKFLFLSSWHRGPVLNGPIDKSRWIDHHQTQNTSDMYDVENNSVVKETQKKRYLKTIPGHWDQTTSRQRGLKERTNKEDLNGHTQTTGLMISAIDVKRCRRVHVAVKS